MKVINYLFILFLLIGSSCNKVENKDITVIDGVLLGGDVRNYNKTLDSLNVNNDPFYTKSIFTRVNDIDDNKIRFYYTNIFDNSDYRTENVSHLGIHYPINMAGTYNMVGLNILLVHTETARLLSNEGLGNITKESGIKGVSQNIVEDEVEYIERMLINKYGKPDHKFNSEFWKMYVIEGASIREYHADSSNTGEMLFWKTKYYDVTFFKGIKSPNYTYNNNEHSYFINFIENPFREIKYNEGERACFAYPYISYTLNDEAIDLLKLNAPKL